MSLNSLSQAADDSGMSTQVVTTSGHESRSANSENNDVGLFAARLTAQDTARPTWTMLGRQEPSNGDQHLAQHRLVDQLHSLYAEKERLEVVLGMSDGDDLIRHVLGLRRDRLAMQADLETALSILQSIAARLEHFP
jgi:hypothetical protein